MMAADPTQPFTGTYCDVEIPSSGFERARLECMGDAALKRLLRPIVHEWRSRRARAALPEAVKLAIRADYLGLPASDPGSSAAIDAALAWLCAAQDRSASADGGVARSYSMISGWHTSYPETTGYIVPTFLHCAKQLGRADLKQRAERMLAWLHSIQLPVGGFQGGVIGATPVQPVVFNTGQILMGLAAGVRELGESSDSLRRAADWLVSIQDPDGCWRKGQSPFAAPGEKAYEAHSAWGLMEAARVEPNRGYGEAALANVRWALRQQRDNGWFDKCCLENAAQPLTHTIGYAMRGVVEAYLFSKDDSFLKAACHTADGVLRAQQPDGFLPGMLASDWSAASSWACLTGTVQIAHCWLLLFRATGNARYRDAAFLANRYVRRAISLDGPPELRGGVKGSFPIDGSYGQYEYLNWAAKFLVDSLLLEQSVRQETSKQ